MRPAAWSIFYGLIHPSTDNHEGGSSLFRFDADQYSSCVVLEGLSGVIGRRGINPSSKGALLSRGAVLMISAVTIAWIFIRLNASEGRIGFDFRLIWIAGRVWSEGASPYGPAFDAMYLHHFSEHVPSHFFVYPPHLILLWPLSWLSFTTAAWAWVVLNVALIAVTGWILVTGPLGVSGHRRWLACALVVAFVATHQGTQFTLLVGQTAIVMTLAGSLFLAGLTARNAWALGLGLFLLSLKPNLAVYPAVVAAAWTYDVNTRELRQWVLQAILGAASAVVVLFSMAALFGGGAVEILGGWVAALARYSRAGIDANASFNLTALPQLSESLAHWAIPKPVSLLLGLLTVLGALWCFRAAANVAYVSLAAIYCFVPLHTYDMVSTTALVPLVVRARFRPALLAAVALVLLHRASNVEFGLDARTWFAGTFSSSVASVLLLLAAIWAARQDESAHSAR